MIKIITTISKTFAFFHLLAGVCVAVVTVGNPATALGTTTVSIVGNGVLTDWAIVGVYST